MAGMSAAMKAVMAECNKNALCKKLLECKMKHKPGANAFYFAKSAYACVPSGLFLAPMCLCWFSPLPKLVYLSLFT